MPSSQRPSALNETTSEAVTSSAGMVSSCRQSSSIRSRTMSRMSPLGSGANPARTTISSSASQPTNPGFLTSRVRSPLRRSSRYTSCSCGLSRLRPIRISVGNFLLLAMRADLDAGERRQVTPPHGLQVHVVQPPVLIPAGVLDVQQVPAVVRPGEHPDAAVPVVGHHPGRGKVDRVVRGDPERGDPDVQHAVMGRDPGQPRPVRRQLRQDAFRVAEQDSARDEIGHALCLPRAGPGRRPLDQCWPGAATPRNPSPGPTGLVPGTALPWWACLRPR